MKFTCDDGDISEEGIFKIARELVLLFLSLEGKRTGYERQRIIPHIHILVYHIPRICSQHNGLRNFSAHGDGEAHMTQLKTFIPKSPTSLVPILM